MSKEKKISEILLSIHRLVEIAETEEMRLNVNMQISNTKPYSPSINNVNEKKIDKIKNSWENIDFNKSQLNLQNQEFELIFRNFFSVWYKEKFRKTFIEQISKHT